MSIGMKVYQKKAQRTSPNDGHDRLDNGVLGMIGEAGELVDVYKKWMYQSGPKAALPVKQIAEELGDMLWYMAEIAAGMESEMLDIIGSDFRDIDARVKRRPVKRTTIRGLVTSIAGRAYELNRMICRSEWRGADTHMRRIIINMGHVAYKAGLTLEEIAEQNIEKLKKRYPKGFDAEISKGRYK